MTTNNYYTYIIMITIIIIIAPLAPTRRLTNYYCNENANKYYFVDYTNYTCLCSRNSIKI